MRSIVGLSWVLALAGVVGAQERVEDAESQLAFVAPGGVHQRLPLPDRTVHVFQGPLGVQLGVVCFQPNEDMPDSPEAQWEQEGEAFVEALVGLVGSDPEVGVVERGVGGAGGLQIDVEGAGARARFVFVVAGGRTYRFLMVGAEEAVGAREAEFEAFLDSVAFLGALEREGRLRAGRALGVQAEVDGRVQTWAEVVLETPSGEAREVVAIEVHGLDAAGGLVAAQIVPLHALQGALGGGESTAGGVRVPAGATLPVYLPPLEAAAEAVRVRVHLRGPDGVETLTVEGSVPEARWAGPARFPLEGSWWVAWGPTAHAPHRRAGALVGEELCCAQRFALDLLQLGPDGSTYAGDPEVLTSYHAYGAVVSAVGSGTVVEVVRDQPDQAIGRMDPSHPRGNYVLVQHGEGVFGTYAHLRPGSVQVEVGDAVEVGQVLGEVGNSGNTSEPHLHLHVSDGPELIASQGLPIRFVGLEQRTPRGWRAITGLPPHGSIVRAPRNETGSEPVSQDED